MKEHIPQPTTFELLGKHIQEMYQQDQEMRKRVFAQGGIMESEEDKTLDERNTEEMKQIVEHIGWPTISKVGKDISNKAWVLVQHADHDVEFQEYCLNLMKSEPEGEVSSLDIAHLEDRVRVNKGLPQLYGTQFYSEGQGLQPRPIEDIEHVEERRKSMGLDTLEENLRILKDKYEEA